MADRWVKLNTNWMESDWLIVLSAEARLAWVQLICYTKTNGLAGRVKAKSAMVFARQNFIGEEAVGQMLLAAKANGALEEEDGDWVLTGWTKHQGKDETAAERMQRYRERRKDTPGDEALRPVTRNVTAEETRGEERRRDKNKPPSPLDAENAAADLRLVEGGEPQDPWEGDSPARQVLDTLLEAEAFQGSSCQVSRVEQVMLDFPDVPEPEWPKVARELRDQAEQWAPAKRSAKLGNPKDPASSLRRFVVESVMPRIKGQPRHRDEGTRVTPAKTGVNDDVWDEVAVT